MKYTLGIDESGTGAWAGPFCVAGVLLPRLMTHPHITDSKKLSDKRRRELYSEIILMSRHWSIETVYPHEIAKRGQGKCWQTAIRMVVREALAVLPEHGIVPTQVDIMIDGSVHHALKKSLEPLTNGANLKFEKKADAKYLAVSCASILAKTHRNDEMNLIDQNYPEYGFAKNSGYGTEEHAEALVCHGRVPHVHRPLVEKHFHTFERKD